jgi:hypothetical protein
MRSVLQTTARANFVYGGCERLRALVSPRVLAEVQREYSERLQAAGALERIFLTLEIRREVRRRLDMIAPSWALY